MFLPCGFSHLRVWLGIQGIARGFVCFSWKVSCCISRTSFTSVNNNVIDEESRNIAVSCTLNLRLKKKKQAKLYLFTLIQVSETPLLPNFFENKRCGQHHCGLHCPPKGAGNQQLCRCKEESLMKRGASQHDFLQLLTMLGLFLPSKAFYLVYIQKKCRCLL